MQAITSGATAAVPAIPGPLALPVIPEQSPTANPSQSQHQLAADSYEQLRRIAAGYLRGERVDHTLQATALVHEAYLRLQQQRAHGWTDDHHFVACAAQAMRRILINYGTARRRLKRGGPTTVRLPLDEALDFCAERNLDLSGIDEALNRLAEVDPRQARIVELRFFGGLTVEEVANELHLSPATVKREWATAKLWLKNALSDWEVYQ